MAKHRKILLFSFSFLLLCSRLLAQQAGNVNSGADTQALLERIAQLEKRVQELETRSGDKNSQVTTAPQTAGQTTTVSAETSVATDAQVNPSQPAPEAPEDRGLKIRGFGQVMFLADDLHGDRPSFGAGNFTLLLTSQLSNKFSAISEIALDEDGYGSNKFGIVLERALLQYEHNDYFKVAGGRYYSSIGYYNTAYYNADWAQTTLRRPVIAAFQDDGGLMPMQRNGVSISGRLPSGALGLHYVAEVGGGDMTRSDVLGLGYEFPIQARTGFNFALFSRPQAIRGLQVGGSVFHDTEIPYINGTGDPLVRQSVYSAYVVYQNPRWEFLNEAYLVHHDVAGFREFNVPAFYTQVSHKLTAAWRPYFRFTYVNAGQNDPMLPDIAGHSTGIETGARYNFSEWVGLKFEYSRMQMNQSHENINFGGTQLVFTF